MQLPPTSETEGEASSTPASGGQPVPTGWQRTLGYGVHLYTASGILAAFAAMAEILSSDCQPRWVFGWLLLATLIDATDGPLARRFQVKWTAAAIDGRTIDDLLDYLTFVFIPLVLVFRMQWLPAGAGWTVALAMGASLLGFAHVHAKEESAGFFRGFPSYWNIYAFYAGLAWAHEVSWLAAVLLWVLTAATVAPIRMIYPNLAPPPWRPWVLGGAAVWTILLVAMLPWYPHVPLIWVILSLVYPLAYFALSLVLDARRKNAVAENAAAPPGLKR